MDVAGEVYWCMQYYVANVIDHVSEGRDYNMYLESVIYNAQNL